MEPLLLYLVIWGQVKNCFGNDRLLLYNKYYNSIIIYQVLFQNGEFLNINYIDDNLKDLKKVPVEFLLQVYLMRCANDYEKECNNFGAQMTDFNMWSRSLSDQELFDWTSCK